MDVASRGSWSRAPSPARRTIQPARVWPGDLYSDIKSNVDIVNTPRLFGCDDPKWYGMATCGADAAEQ